MMLSWLVPTVGGTAILALIVISVIVYKAKRDHRLRQVSLLSELEMQEITCATNTWNVAFAENLALGGDQRFVAAIEDIVLGRPEQAARGLNSLLGIEDAILFGKMAHGLQSIVDEFNEYGTDDDRECLEYILKARAGSSKKTFFNGQRDQGRCGEQLVDFVNHQSSVNSGLTVAHVVALRLYTTVAYTSINNPLRKTNKSQPYCFPVTLSLIAEGLKRLRTVGASEDDAHQERVLWRGMRNVRTTRELLVRGGTELAPMSATSDLKIALAYSMSSCPVLFKIVTKSFMDRRSRA